MVDSFLFVGVSISLFYDLKFREIPDWLTYPLILSGVVLNGYFGGIGGIILSIISGLFGFLLFGFFAFGKGFFGGGDVKLIAGVSTVLSIPLAFWAWVFISIYGGLFALAIVIYKRRLKETLKNLLYIFRRKELKESIVIPYAPAIWFGVITTIFKFHLLSIL